MIFKSINSRHAWSKLVQVSEISLTLRALREDGRRLGHYSIVDAHRRIPFCVFTSGLILFATTELLCECLDRLYHHVWGLA
jgi:hypothetical protein